MAGTAWNNHAYAQDQHTRLTDSALQNLGIDFSNRIGEKLEEADLFLTGAGRLELAEQKSGTFLPDNEPIIFNALFGSNYISTPQDIYAIKRNHRLLISLADFTLASQLPIKVIADKNVANGWIRQKDQTFALDAANRQITLNGVTNPVSKDDLALDEGHILVSTDMLEKWFNISFDYNFSDLTLIISNKNPLPIELAYARSQRQRSTSENYKAKLPFKKTSYGLISLPYFDNDVTRTWSLAPGAKTARATSWSSIITGDFAGFNTQGFVSGDDLAPYIDSARISMGKDDPDANLLGPLHATSYRFGDIDTVSSPLIGGGAQEQGIEITNAPLDRSTTETYTQIRGDNQPGWDVELYRNDVYLDIRHVRSDGIYDFGNVDLNVGDNIFKLVFYGPQGETREETRAIRVNPYISGNKQGTYSASLSRQNITTFQRLKPTAEGSGEVRAAARYEFGIPGFGTANLGMRSNNDLGTRRTLAQAGVATGAYGAFLNADVGVDAENQAMAGILTARRNIGTQALFGQYLYNSENFDPINPDGQASVKDSFRIGVSGPLSKGFLIFANPNYNLNGSITDLYSGDQQRSASLGITSRVGGKFGLSSNFQYNEVLQKDGPTTKNASLLNTARGSLWGGVWRTSTLYSIQPETQMQSASAEYNRQILSNLDSNTEITYTPRPKTTTLNAGLNWHTKYADINPSLQYDTNHNLNLGVNLHFGMGADPYSYRYNVYNNYVSSSGGVAARIFQDKNGNGVYDDGDKLLPDVQLISEQTSQSATSNKDGIALIPDIEKNHLTDIYANPSSSSDLYGYSMFEGVSLRAHPGSVTKLDFPITEGGEMDGQADIVYDDNTRKPASALTLNLVTPDGIATKNALVASDGYWSISNIRPGFYYLIGEWDDALTGYLAPRLVQFKPDGTTLYGEKIELRGDARPVKFTFRSTNAPPDGPLHARTLVPSDIKSQETILSLGAFHSRIALNFSWYKFRLQNPGWGNVFELVTPVSETTPDKKSQEMMIQLRPKKHLSPQEAGLACQDFSNIKFDCAIEVITTYRDYVPVKGKPDNAIDRLIASISGKNATLTPVSSPAQQPKIYAATRELQEAIAKTPEMPKTVKQYAAINPTVDVKALRHQTVILNLGSFNSRELMALTWFKVKKKYGTMIGDARLLVQPSDSYASLETGKHTLLATSPNLDEAEAQRRCSLLTAQGQYCAIEVIPAAEQQGMTATENGAPPKT